MPNNYLSVLYKHIIQVENKNVGLKVGGGHKHTIPPPPPIIKVGGHMPPSSPIHILHAPETPQNTQTLKSIMHAEDIQRNINLVKHCSTVFKLVV